MDPKLFPPETLFYWLTLPHNPVFASEDPLTRMLIEAMLKNEPVEFIYVGGSKPGSPRRVNVSLVFQHEPAGGFTCRDIVGNAPPFGLSLSI